MYDQEALVRFAKLCVSKDVLALRQIYKDEHPDVAAVLNAIIRTARVALREHKPSPSITCPRCAHTSYHHKDIEYGYCGACHDWTGQMRPMVRDD